MTKPSSVDKFYKIIGVFIPFLFLYAKDWDTFKEKRATATASKTQRRLDYAQKQADDLAKTGRSIASAQFPSAWMASVEVFEKGYVRIKGSTEKLISISASDGTTTKSALGRGLGAIATFGVNMHGSKLRGQAYLIVTTESQTVSIHLEAPTPKELSDLHRIVAAGESALLKRESNSTSAQQSTTVTKSLAEQIDDLAKLHTSGVLTDEEFTQAKSRLLEP